MVGIVLPSPKAVRDLLEELLGRDVELTLGPPVVPSRAVRAAVGVYVDDRLSLCAVVVADLAFAARAGACIGLVPVGGAEAAIEDGQLAPNLSENFFEIVNIMAALFNLPGRPHVRLDSVVDPGEEIPADASRLTSAYINRLDLDIAIGGYGSGALSFVLPS